MRNWSIEKAHLSAKMHAMGEESADVEAYPRAIVALAGARDHYQLPLALHEKGLLGTFVTDVYWPADRPWFSTFLSPLLPDGVLSARSCTALGSANIRISPKASVASALMHMAPQLKLNRYKDRALGSVARKLALRDDAPLLSTSYYAYEAFRGGRERLSHRLFFQLQAHPRAVREILLEEIERNPYAKQSLAKEYEISLGPRQFEELSDEPHLANGWIATSSFAARTMSDQGIPAPSIRVVPYGVDSETFLKRTGPSDKQKPLTVIYVGSLTQRKGLSYLLDAVRLLQSRSIRLVLYTRGFSDRRLLAAYPDLNLIIKMGLSGVQLAQEMAKSDIFVFPSLCEGFGHVVLEAMSCGLPVIATMNTCAPDVIIEGKQGFIVQIRDSEKIAEHLAWAMDHRTELAEMGEAAALQARLFSWDRFRIGVRDAYMEMVMPVPEGVQTHFV